MANIGWLPIINIIYLTIVFILINNYCKGNREIKLKNIINQKEYIYFIFITIIFCILLIMIYWDNTNTWGNIFSILTSITFVGILSYLLIKK